MLSEGQSVRVLQHCSNIQPKNLRQFSAQNLFSSGGSKILVSLQQGFAERSLIGGRFYAGESHFALKRDQISDCNAREKDFGSTHSSVKSTLFFLFSSARFLCDSPSCFSLVAFIISLSRYPKGGRAAACPARTLSPCSDRNGRSSETAEEPPACPCNDGVRDRADLIKNGSIKGFY